MADLSNRRGYLTIDAMVALAITTLAVGASVALASSAVSRVATVRDRLTAARIAEDIYEDLYVGERPDGSHTGTQDGRNWTYVTRPAGTPETPSSARHARIVVDRRIGRDLIVEAYLRPAPAIPSSN